MMDFTQFSLNDVITISLIIAQGGITYYRLKKVEQKTEQFNNLLVEFAVHKTSLKHHKYEFDKQTSRIEAVIQRLDDRLSGIETHAYEALLHTARLKDKS